MVQLRSFEGEVRDTIHIQTEVRSLLSKQSPFTARNFVSAWKEITSDPEILDFVQHCHIEFTDDPSI